MEQNPKPPNEQPRHKLALLPTAMAALGAALYGLAEAGRVALSATFYRDDLTIALLVGLGALLVVPVGSSLGLLAGLALARAARPVRAWAGLLAGLLAIGLWDIAVRWFTDPRPFTDPFPFQNDPRAFGVIAVALFALCALLVWRLRSWRAVSIGMAACAAALAAWTASAIPWGVERGTPGPDQPNVLWVTIDTVRADHMSTYGGRAETPAFQRLADEGVLFAQAFAQIAVTGPSHTTMLTGTGPWNHGTLLNGIPIDGGLATLPEVARLAGYRTSAFVSAYVLEGELGFARGFDVYDDEFGWSKGLDDLVSFRSLAMVQRHFNPDLVVERIAEDTVDEALGWLGQQQEPWFIWVHLFDPHGPYEPPPPYDSAYYAGDPRSASHSSMDQVQDVAPYLEESLQGITDVEWVLAQYDGEISYTDHQLARLLAYLDEEGLAERTLVAVNGDHGESLGENEVWFDHGDDLYDPSTWVPMALRMPGRLKARRRVREPVELVDLAPTMLELMALQAPDTMKGRSLMEVVEGPGSRLQARGLCFDRPANVAAREAGEIDKPKWRLASLRASGSLFVRREAPRYGDEYYELAEDPGQERNLFEERRAETEGEQLLGYLTTQTNGLLEGMSDEQVDRSNAELTDETQDALRALGYIE